MIRRFVIFAVLFAAALPLCAQESSGRDRPLEEMEAKLQEQRATAVRARLVLYLDELDRLHAQFTASNDTASAVAVKAEMDAVQVDMRRLANTARRQADPPAPDEVQKGEEISAATLASRRINKIIERFNADKAAPRSAGGATALASSRTLVLKFDKAARMSGYSDYSSRSYWGIDGAFAQWSVSNLPPGEYEIIFRYTPDSLTGGKAIVKAGGAKPLPVTVPRGAKGSTKEQRLSAGTIIVKEQGVDLRVEYVGLAPKADSLWNLEAVIVQPAVKRP